MEGYKVDRVSLSDMMEWPKVNTTVEKDGVIYLVVPGAGKVPEAVASAIAERLNRSRASRLEAACQELSAIIDETYSPGILLRMVEMLTKVISSVQKRNQVLSRCRPSNN